MGVVHRWFPAAAGCVGAIVASLAATPAVAQQANKTPIQIQMVWRLQLSATDYFDSLSKAEYDNYPTNAGLAYYIPKTNWLGNQVTLNRFHKTASGQHIPSNTSSMSGATLDGRIGYGFAAASDMPGGLTVLKRLRNETTIDAFLGLPGETRSGYTVDTLSGYAWARNLTNNENNISLTAGGIAIESNLNAGGALWKWTYNGKQYINIRDYGREIQAAYTSPNEIFSQTINPTEGGSGYSDLSRAIPLRQGSPLISANNSGSTQSTRCCPLEWDQTRFGFNTDTPLYWNDAVLGKDVTLGYQGRNGLAKYLTVLTPSWTSSASAIEIPTAYLNGDFSRYYTYDAGASAGNRLHEVDPPNGNVSPYRIQFTPASGFGGVIISTSDQNHAMGIYGCTVAMGGSVDYFTLWDFRYLGGTTSTSGGTSKWSVAYGPDGAFGRTGPTLQAGHTYTFCTWVMTGTLAQVQGHMDWLKGQNLHGAVVVTP